ncbi:MAG: hypothetical protein M0P31_00500 [Solirubrobacteraceae bacterium]|nr:hypothetical protein [Solirubrobacteraceae bacterium]
MPGALVRAARAGRMASEGLLLRALDDALGPSARITEIEASPAAVERHALRLVRRHGLRTLDAWHLAVASIALLPIADGEPIGFASRDDQQAAVAESLGFTAL